MRTMRRGREQCFAEADDTAERTGSHGGRCGSSEGSLAEAFLWGSWNEYISMKGLKVLGELAIAVEPCCYCN